MNNFITYYDIYPILIPLKLQYNTFQSYKDKVISAQQAVLFFKDKE
ncbi:hypothetical protein [Flavobacterium sp. ZS1P14]